MRAEQKIILSLYYADPNTDASKIKEIKYSLGMDMSQLMLLMEGVFDEIEYKYQFENDKMSIVPTIDKREEYESFIYRLADNPELEKAKIINISPDLQNDLQSFNYQNINKYNEKLPDAKKHLYFFNMLVSNVNGRSTLGTRETLIYYRLFSCRNGKEFISCLMAMLINILNTIHTDSEETGKVVSSLNRDYEQICLCYAQREEIMQNMQRHEQEVRHVYETNFFINQSESFKNWIADHQSVEGDMLEFIFYKNDALKNYAFHLMQHIVKISRILLSEKRMKVSWEENIDLENVPVMTEFYHLNQLLKELENERSNSLFDVFDWKDRYISKLYDFAKELKFVSF